ncbi:MAG: hypothetical protein M1820_010554 [Bogoriella megaspora]|nr:MAG: hypothetical protein M1820_010554 [Bogoriella megaspora]
MDDNPVQLIIRFATSIPDLSILIPTPQTTTTLALKQQIRTHLPLESASNRLRLIHAGKVLPDTALLSTALHIPPPPPRSTPTPNQHDSQPSDTSEKTSKSKGKEPIRDTPSPSPPIPRVYIHCSIGDPLSPSSLTAEAHAASHPIKPHLPSTVPQTHHVSPPPPPPSDPQGFDRLLSPSFTREDIAALRAQFLALQAHTHTPDTMPRGRELRLLEERWLDSEAFAPPQSSASPSASSGNPTTITEGAGIGGAGAGTTAGGLAGWGTGGGGGWGEDAGLEDMLIGNVMGFFWPLGAVCWLLREEGVWTQRRQIAVFTGLVVNAAFGFWRMAG